LKILRGTLFIKDSGCLIIISETEETDFTSGMKNLTRPFCLLFEGNLILNQIPNPITQSGRTSIESPIF